MSNTDPPSDYDASDSWLENGLECCAECKTKLRHKSPVYEANGETHDHLHESEPDHGPLFCSPCWSEVQTAKHRAENETLDTYIDRDPGAYSSTIDEMGTRLDEETKHKRKHVW